METNAFDFLKTPCFVFISVSSSILKTRAIKSGRSDVCSRGLRLSTISDHVGFAVNVMNRSGASHFEKIDEQIGHCVAAPLSHVSWKFFEA